MVATLMLSVVAIIASNINDRCLNISYKRIFFTKFLYKNNCVTLAFNMLIAVFIGFIEYLLGLRIMLFITLISTTYFLVQLLIMMYIMVSKKSLMYIRLYDTIETDKEVLEKCVIKVKDWNVSHRENTHNQYIIQELALLKRLEDNTDNVEEKNKCKGCAIILICNEKDYLDFENNLDYKIHDINLFNNVDEKNDYKHWLKQLHNDVVIKFLN